MSRRHFNHREEQDPVGMLSNLFDVAMVFAVALMVALVTKFNMTEIFSKDDFTIVKNPGKENMEIIRRFVELMKLEEDRWQDRSWQRL